MTKRFKQEFVEILATMVEPKFVLFQMQKKDMLEHGRKLVEAIFSKAPERLDALDVGQALHEFVVAVVNAVVPVEPRHPPARHSCVSHQY